MVEFFNGFSQIPYSKNLKLLYNTENAITTITAFLERPFGYFMGLSRTQIYFDFNYTESSVAFIRKLWGSH